MKFFNGRSHWAVLIALSFLVAPVWSQKGKATVLKFETDIYPHEVGHYKGKAGTHYFALSKRRLMVLDNKFKQIEKYVIDQDVSAIDFGDINKDGRDDLILISHDGISIQLQDEDGEFEKRVLTLKEQINVPLFPEDIPRHNIGLDVDKDGDYDLILPGINRLVYYQNNFSADKKLELANQEIRSSVWSMVIELPIQHTSKFSAEVLQYSGIYGNHSRAITDVPLVYSEDFNKDGLLDIYCRIDKIFYYFLSGKPSSDQMDKDKTLDKNKVYHFMDRKVRLYPVSTAGQLFSSAHMHDFNKDGKLDLLYSIVRGNGIVYNTQSFIFWGGKEEIPDVEKRFYSEQKGAFVGVVPILNKKNEMTLLYPNVDVGVGTAMSYLVGKGLTVNMATFTHEKNEWKEKNNFNIAINTDAGSVPGFATGDFNGDGTTDIAIGYDTKQTFIYKGSEKMSKDILYELNLAGTGNFKSIPAEGGKSDLLIYYPYYVKDLDRKHIYLIRFQ